MVEPDAMLAPFSLFSAATPEVFLTPRLSGSCSNFPQVACSLAFPAKGKGPGRFCRCGSQQFLAG